MFESLGILLSRHRAVTRVSAVALALTVVFTVAAHEATRAGPQSGPGSQVRPTAPESILPLSVGSAVATGAAISIPFDRPMDAASVEAELQLYPHQPFEVSWNAEGTVAHVRPERLWRTDETYVIVVAADATTVDGAPLEATKRFSFTTATATAISDFQVRLAPSELDAELLNGMAEMDPEHGLAGGVNAAPPLDTGTTAQEVSASTAITITFDAAMDRADALARFAISPDVDGELSWEGDALVFRPSARFAPGKRYTVSMVGAHDASGNVIGGKTNFSFVVRTGAQLTKVSPGIGEANVETDSIEMWFSQPMDVESTNAAVTLTDTTAGAEVGASLEWNEIATQLTLTPDDPLAAGHQFTVAIGDGALDRDGNAVSKSWSFTTLAPPPAPVQRSTATTRTATPVVVPPPAPPVSGDMAAYAVSQINASRAAYGFAPVSLDAAISAVAYAHAYDQAVNNYFSHTSLDGRSREDRLRAGGVSFSYSGENQCYLVGRSVQATLDWCHAQFMAEPYPGHFNHIANVLDPRAHRVGVGIAQVGSKIVIVWDFTD